MIYDALYGRQSIDKKDSISVESQLEYCRYETHGEPYLEYTDRGFSGKDLKRPGFEKMMADITGGRIRRVIVYKLDRISRSILDFANMMEFFQKNQVEFVSSTEKFDTSTPIGRAMLNICIVFAQLERETIQKRVTDAYYARSKRGFYMGGRIPYGYRLKKTVLDGIHTSMYEEVPEESVQLKLIYSLYADGSHSLGDIVRYLNERRIENLRGSIWNTARISEMLRNPIYVQADTVIYHFFKRQGAVICNPVEDFTGSNGCYLYRTMTSSGTGKRYELADKELVLAPHQGFIPSALWLTCRMRCMNNRQSTKTCKAKNSWLTGKVKCGNCGYALTVRKSNTRHSRYFVCSAPVHTDGCKGTGCTVYADVLEDYMAKAICNKLSELENVPETNTRLSIKEKKKENLLQQTKEEIEELLSRVPEADKVLMAYINEKVEKLDTVRRRLEKELSGSGNAGLERQNQATHFTAYANQWRALSFEDKQTVTDLLLEKICIAKDTLWITWRI